jgi:hypothetical protein
MWQEHSEYKDPFDTAEELGKELEAKLGLPMCILSKEQSKFFKRHYQTDYRNHGLLVTEMDVIRKIEGW